jgi:hypothetical protein
MATDFLPVGKPTIAAAFGLHFLVEVFDSHV